MCLVRPPHSIPPTHHTHPNHAHKHTRASGLFPDVVQWIHYDLSLWLLKFNSASPQAPHLQTEQKSVLTRVPLEHTKCTHKKRKQRDPSSYQTHLNKKFKKNNKKKQHFLVNPDMYEKRLEGNYFNASQFSKDSNRPALSSILL